MRSCARSVEHECNKAPIIATTSCGRKGREALTEQAHSTTFPDRVLHTYRRIEAVLP